MSSADLLPWFVAATALGAQLFGAVERWRAARIEETKDKSTDSRASLVEHRADRAQAVEEWRDLYGEVRVELKGYRDENRALVKTVSRLERVIIYVFSHVESDYPEVVDTAREMLKAE